MILCCIFYSFNNISVTEDFTVGYMKCPGRDSFVCNMMWIRYWNSIKKYLLFSSRPQNPNLNKQSISVVSKTKMHMSSSNCSVPSKYLLNPCTLIADEWNSFDLKYGLSRVFSSVSFMDYPCNLTLMSRSSKFKKKSENVEYDLNSDRPSVILSIFKLIQ